MNWSIHVSYDSYPPLLFCCAMVSGFIQFNLMKVCLLEVLRFLYSSFFFFSVQSNFINCQEEEEEKMTLLWFCMEAFKEKDLGFTFLFK